MSKLYKTKDERYLVSDGTVLKPITDEKVKHKCQSDLDKIQPSDLRKDYNDILSEIGFKTYDTFCEKYKELCDLDETFVLTFVAERKDGDYHPFSFFRMCDIEKQERFQKSIYHIGMKMFSYLHFIGFLKILEEKNFIRVNPNLYKK